MPADPTVTGAWDIAASRNLGIPFNYIWDKPNSYWRPMGLGDLGSYKDRLTASADSTELKYGSNPSVANSVSINSPETVWDGSTEYVFPPDGGTGIQISSSSNSDNQPYCILGLDTDFNEQTGTGLLNGTGVVNVDGNGEATMQIEPPLKTAVAEDDVVVYTNTVCVMRMQTPDLSWSADRISLYGISFAAEEVT